MYYVHLLIHVTGVLLKAKSSILYNIYIIIYYLCTTRAKTMRIKEIYFDFIINPCLMNKLKLKLRGIHANTLRNGTDFTKFLITQLLRIPDIEYAHKLLDTTPKPTVFLYNKVIQAYSIHGPHQQSFYLYIQMHAKSISPNPHSFPPLFAASTACSSPNHGQMLHTHLVKLGFEFDVFSLTALIDMYAKLGLLPLSRQVFDEMIDKDVPTWNSLIAGYTRFGDLVGALKLFDEMPVKNVVTWTAMISGYLQNGKYWKALSTFLEMEKVKGVRPNEVTIASILPACAHLGALEVGQRIESYARASGYFGNMFVCNAILEMYARCGRIDVALLIFDEIGTRRNLCSWNTMIVGLAVHGKCKEALELFDQMLREGTQPDDVSFVGAFLACTHGGMVDKGRKLFKSMDSKFFITPKLEHYGCMVDLLGRAGELQEAYDLIQSMPMKPDSVVWGALLGACSFHKRDVHLAEKAAEFLFIHEPRNPGNYVILSNIYANTGRWDRVARLRKMMKGCEIVKAAGHSCIEWGGRIHKFIVEDHSHPRSNEVYRLLNEISLNMKLQDDLNSTDDEMNIMEML